MKKIYTAIIACAAAVFLLSCQRGDENSIFDLDTAVRIEEYFEASVPELAIGAMGFLGYMALKPDKLEVSSYRIETQGKEEDIWCLSVTGMGDELTQQKLNQTIQTELRLWIKDYLEGPLDVGNSIDGYFIADRYLCVTGSYGNYGNRGPWKEYYCAVYDLKNGEKVYLGDLWNNFAHQAQNFFTKSGISYIIHSIHETKRFDEKSTCTKAFQRTSPRTTAAERDGAGGMWKMVSEQRTEPGLRLGCDRFRLL